MPRGPGKGNTNNPSGKPKGIKNKRTLEWEQLGEFLTDKGAKRAMTVLESLSDEDYLDQYGKLLNYFKPRMAQSQIEHKGNAFESVNITIEKPKPDGHKG